MADDIVIPKAPKGWRPTSDQQQRIQQDPRLQRMSPDEQYFFFNQPRTPSTGQTRRTATPPPTRPQSSPGVFGWIDTVRRAMGGD